MKYLKFYLLRTKKTLENIYTEFRRATLLPKGKFLRKVFATKELENENFSEFDTMQQLNVYFQTYGLRITVPNLYPEDRKVELTSVSINEKVSLNDFLKFITVKNTDEFQKDLKTIVYMPIVFGAEQIDLIQNAFDSNLLLDVLTDDFKIKENMFKVIDIIGKNNIKKVNIFKTANDILRYALYISNQNWIKFELKGKFKISTSDKKVIMRELDKLNIEFAFNDIKPRRSLWLKVGINIHPKSKTFSKYKNAQQLFEFLREGNAPFKTYNQLTASYIVNKDFKGLFDHLKINSGYLMRSLLMLMRNSSDIEFNYITNELENIKLNPKLVMQLKALVNYQAQSDILIRNFNIKGKLVKVIDKPLLKLREDRVEKIVNSLNNILINTFKNKKLIDNKKIYIDNVLKRYIVPTEIRNLSKTSSGVIFTPESRIPLPENIKYVRLFTAWGGKKSNLSFDIDLSASFIKGANVEEVAFYSQSGSVAQHSGDKTSCLKWNENIVTAEYIDIDIKKAKLEKIDYMQTSQFIFGAYGVKNDYDTDINCYSGIQLLENRIEKNDYIDISDSILKLKLAGDYQSHLTLAIDFNTNEIVIIDRYDESERGCGAYTIRNQLDMFKMEYFEAINMKMNMFELLELYCKSNNIELVSTVEDADIVCSYNDMEDKEVFNISNNLERIVNLLSQ